jgi:hypothetical protein
MNVLILPGFNGKRYETACRTYSSLTARLLGVRHPALKDGGSLLAGGFSGQKLSGHDHLNRGQLESLTKGRNGKRRCVLYFFRC